MTEELILPHAGVLKIALVTESGTPEVTELANALSRSGVDVTVHGRAGELSKFAVALTGRLRLDRPDLVHAFSWTSGLAALQAVRDRPLPVVQTLHAPDDPEAPKAEYGRRMRRLVGRLATVVVAQCRQELAELVALGVPRSKITLVPRGVDCDLFAPGGGPATEGFKLVSAMDGADDVLRALPKDAELVVLGLDGSGPALLRRAKKLGIANRVRVAAGSTSQERAQWLRWADTVVCVPRRDVHGQLALEAMACGTAVVATDVGCLHDTVADGVTGEHVQPGQLAKVLRRLGGEPVTLQQYGISARDRAVSRYRLDRVAAELGRLYQDTAGVRLPATLSG